MSDKNTQNLGSHQDKFGSITVKLEIKRLVKRTQLGRFSIFRVSIQSLQSAKENSNSKNITSLTASITMKIMLNLKKRWVGVLNVRVVFFLFLFIQTYFSFSQQPNLEFRTLNALEIMTNSKATAIIQDTTGFLWIGTQEGLFRFDGQTVFPYYVNINDSNSIPANKINKLFVDCRKKIWICTSSGLCFYNPKYDNFTHVVTDESLKGMPGTDIYVINEDNTGQLYIGFEKSIYKYDTAKNLFLKVLELDKGKINAIDFDDQNNIWIAASAEGGLFYYDQQNKRIMAFRNDPNNKQSLSSNEIVDVVLIIDKLWLASYGAGFDCYDLESKTFKNYKSPNFFENFSLGMFVDLKHNLWIYTLGNLKLFDPKSDSFFNYYHDANNAQSIGNSLTGFYEDRDGNYWTIHSLGAIKYTEKENKFKHFSPQSDDIWKTSEKNITTLSNDSAGNLWVGNFYNGIDVFSWKENRVDRYLNKAGDLSSLGNGTIFSIFRDSKNQMWVGSNLGGLQKFNPNKKNFETYLNKPDDTLSIAGNDVRSITQDLKGNLWIAILGKGVDYFNISTKTFSHYNTKNNHLSNDYTFQTFNDSKDNLWVASAYGLNLLPKGEKIFKSFINSKTDTNSVSSNIIQAIHEDLQQNIWIGTPSGLDKYNPEKQTFTRYSYLLRNKNVGSILNDSKNNLWIGTNSGISKLNQQTKKISNFDQNDGLFSREFFPLASYTDDNKELFFGGSDGIDVFNTDSLNTDIKPPKIIFTDFKLFNKSINYKSNPEIIDKSISYADEIVLDYRENSISISFQAIKLTKPEKITYSCKLEGFDMDWNNIGTKKEASYNNLKPGKYTFSVKARYDNGNWSENATSIQINIAPAWWMTIWFKIIAAMILLLTPFFFIRWRIRRLEKQKEILEAIVANRTSEIQTQNRLLKDLNSTKVKLFSIISHDLRSPFNSILGFQEHLINEYPNLTDTERIDMLNKAHSSSKQFYTLVENLLSWSMLQTNAIHYDPVKFNLHSILHEWLSLYQSLAESKGITFEEDIAENLHAFADINLLQSTLRNLITNAIKFTAKDGSILVKAVKKDDWLVFSVADSGKGMTEKDINTLFKLDKMKSQKGTNGENGTGLGLLLCKDFIEKNKGKLTIESELEKGSTFSFTIPASDQS